MTEPIKPGDVVWVLDRKRVRDGVGPTPIRLQTISTLGWCTVNRSRGLYHVNDLFADEGSARLAWVERAKTELAAEQSRFNKIAAKLSAWERVVG